MTCPHQFLAAVPVPPGGGTTGGVIHPLAVKADPRRVPLAACQPVPRADQSPCTIRCRSEAKIAMRLRPGSPGYIGNSWPLQTDN